MNRLTQQHRAKQLLLRRATETRVRQIWPVLEFADLDSTFPKLAVQVAALVATNRATSAGVASKYVRDMRTSARFRGGRIVIPEPLPAEQLTVSLRATSLAAIKKATVLGTASDAAMGNALTRTQGAMSRLVLNAGRETVRQTAVSDDVGWVRVGHGECDWCKQYLDGEVHYAVGYDFDAHDGCGCTAEPVYT